MIRGIQEEKNKLEEKERQIHFSCVKILIKETN